MDKLAKYPALIIILFFFNNSFAQPIFSEDLYYDNKVTYEIGASVGAMNCLTDLGGNKGKGGILLIDVNLGYTRPAASIFLGAYYKNFLGIRTEATWGIVKASDLVLKKEANNPASRYHRGLSFRSPIFEFSIVGEIHPIFYKQYSRGEKLPRFSPYALGGIGYFSFNPQAKFESAWVDLRSLSTEGQGFAEYPDRKAYKLKQLNFPVGAGVKYKYNELFNISAEFVYRFLRTDYLDDVSTSFINPIDFQKYFGGDILRQAEYLNNPNNIGSTGTADIFNSTKRGNSDKKDSFFSLNFKVALIF